MELPFGMTEAEWNRLCDSQKCEFGCYCNSVLGWCKRHRELLEKVKVLR